MVEEFADFLKAEKIAYDAKEFEASREEVSAEILEETLRQVFGEGVARQRARELHAADAAERDPAQTGAGQVKRACGYVAMRTRGIRGICFQPYDHPPCQYA